MRFKILDRTTIHRKLKVYMTDVFICSIKSPQYTDKLAVFRTRVFMYQIKEVKFYFRWGTNTGDCE